MPLPKSDTKRPTGFVFLSVLILIALFFQSCQKELEFETQTFEKKTSLPCKGVCPHVVLKIPIAKNQQPQADSINNKVFSVLKQIIYFGEKPYDAKDYKGLVTDFMASYEKTQRDNPDDLFGWEGEVTGKVIYTSENLIDIEIQHYTFTGGAHGYAGKRSLLFDAQTGKSVPNEKLFSDVKGFTKLAESKFRKQYGIDQKAPINSDGFMFETQSFTLPETIFFTKSGILLYYNPYEIASYADGPQQILIPMAEAKPFLAIE
ncbi:DUF3298 and DUF4163 domain-containing protein [Flavobacterium silvaticum]|uniref:DUF3298 and DUF4163 domain-containing protein n=1 Tax=Flavobacterium silvaticum TaxID=1852020 RepID=A0A972JG97_9FLAO|nr:DUF3298 and DUF4163 domain-containing protein [Flavobacterium silvaticum]NMH26625.1 DUF3298 and DUF4163 domain-containing protein [Flavobacterium silvaticum]